MTSDRGLQGALQSWLHEDRHEDATRILHTVLDGVGTTPQHRPRWSVGGMLTMNKFVAIGLGAAAVVVVLLIGSNLLGSGSPPPGGEVPESVAPSEAPSEAPSVEPSTSEFLPEGPFAWLEPTVLSEPRTDVPPITVTIPASGWACLGYEDCILIKGGGEDSLSGSDDRLPESALIATFATSGIHVYQDPCQWEYDLPDLPSTTADEIAAALAAQPSRDASDPVDVTVGGYPGKMVTLHVPDDARYSDATGFADCFRGVYASYTYGDHDDAGTVPTRWHEGAGQIDTFWIIEVDDAIVIIDAMYRADTPADRIEEMRSIAESATFE